MADRTRTPPRPENALNESAQINADMDFLLFIDRLKEVERQNSLVSSQRRERTAEHSWHVAIAALCLQAYAAEPIDIGRAVQLAIVHDLPEVVVGDTFVYGAEIDTRQEREAPAMKALTSTRAGSAGPEIMRAWQDYEYERTPEGRFVMAVDVLLPIFINLATGSNSSWARHGVTASEVRKRVDRVRAAVPLLAHHADQAIDKAVARGLLR